MGRHITLQLSRNMTLAAVVALFASFALLSALAFLSIRTTFRHGHDHGAHEAPYRIVLTH